MGVQANNADAIAASSGGNKAAVFAFLGGYNGTTWDRLRVDANKNLQVTLGTQISGEDQTNNLLKVGQPANQWVHSHAPVVNNGATCTQPAGAAGVKNVCTSITAAVANDATGTVQAPLHIVLRDGASGAGSILWMFWLSLPATPGDCRIISLSGLWIIGTAATAMTLEGDAAPALHTALSVAMTGVTIQ